MAKAKKWFATPNSVYPLRPATNTGISKYWVGRQAGAQRVIENAKKYKNPLRPLDDPNALTDPLVPREFLKERRSAVNLKYKPQLDALQADISRSDARSAPGGTIDTTFSGYKNDLGQLDARVAARNEATLSGLAQKQQAAEQAGVGERQKVVEQAMADAAARGQQVDPQLALKAQQAAQAQGASGREFQAALGQVASGMASELGANRTNADVAKAQALTDEEANRRALGDKKVALRSEMGDFSNQYLADARDAERKNRLAGLAFGLDQYKAIRGVQVQKKKMKYDAAAKRRDQALRAAEISSNERIAATKEAAATQRAALKAAGKGGGGARGMLTKAQVPKYMAQLDSAVVRARTLAAQGVSPAQIRQRLLQGEKTQSIVNGQITESSSDAYEPTQVNAAMDIVVRGGLGPANRSALAQLGVPARKYGVARKPTLQRQIAAKQAQTIAGSLGG